MLDSLKKMFSLMEPKERRHLWLLTFAVTGMALLEVAGIASVMPFLALAGNPKVVETNRWLHAVYVGLGFTSTRNFILFAGGFALSLLVVGNFYKMVVTWLQIKFVQMRNHSISRKMLIGYVRQDYTFFLNRNTSEMGAKVLDEVSRVIFGVLLPLVLVSSRIIVALSILALMVLVDWTLTLGVAVVLCISYGLIFLVVRRKLEKIGKIRTRSIHRRFVSAGEVLSGIKDIKILNRENQFLRDYSAASKEMAQALTFNEVVAQAPRFFMETVAFGGMLVIVLYSMLLERDASAILPLVGLYAFAGYRLMPSVQQIYNGITNIRFNRQSLDELYEDMRALSLLTGDVSLLDAPPAPLAFERELRLEKLRFAYPGTDEEVLREVDITIPKNAVVGLVGSTGAGKTTLVDIVLGLLTPREGQLSVDGQPVTRENNSAWQRRIGYVPQSIFISDNTVAANIALGVAPEKVDMAAVERAARTAHLHDFVMNELPDGYQTFIGERGVRLSGGQRQRIGIARALYHEPDVLVLDEATSALDGVTEAAVMEAVNGLVRAKTVIMIAHRLTTLRECDVIHVLEKGRVRTSGTYEELLERDEVFQSMARGADAPLMPAQ